MIVTVEVFNSLYCSVYRKPIGMYVPKTHEDGDHDTTFVEILILFYFLYNNDMSIGWSYYNLLGIFAIKIADRTAIKV